ncbi:uncharacterized protein LOC115445651 isoform X7 [Manduca sexta]|uniref:uncharacterized protein LOC115445651 isoform X7 n=1 Tax=Manduca sexta TaxID=7130 RepID=UPI0011845111|nr:uncharacterized protein LOC115445651 isoform X7 [Manduca sexta]
MEIENSKQVVESTKLQAHGLHKPMFAKSGDKLMTTYVKNKNIIEQNKKKCTSKLPRFVRNSSFYRTNKNLCKQNGKDNAGDIIIGTNKRSNRIQKPKSNEPHKQKPSGIPRRKDINEESITDNASLKKQSEHLFEAKNIQRIQMLINADLCPEDRTQATSVVSAKPIPTLGQIYRPDSLIETDRFHDWFMSLNTPLNSFEFNPAIQLRHSIDSDHRESPLCDVEIDTSYDDSTLVVDRINLIQQIYKTTNESVKEWITSDVECLGVDNESGYRSSSPENLRRAIIINSKQTAPSVKSTHENNEINVTKKTSVKFSNDSNDIEKEGIVKKEECLADSSKINEINTEFGTKQFRLSKDSTYQLFEHEEYILKVKELNDQDRECRKENISYIECPSEILQKTINFEGCDSSKTVSSILATDTELIEELSSQCTLERIDDCSILEVHSADDWTPQCKSRRSENLLKTPSNDKETALKYLHRNSREHDENNSRQHYHNSNCWKKQLLRQKFKTRCSKKERCKKCRRFRTYPSIRYRFTKRLDSFRKQLWVRICRKRWNHVWKKTAERWALWSKSPSKLKKVRMMHYLQRAIIWEDAKVQTTLLVFRETGTGTVLREQKSAAISALIKFESNKYYDLPNTSKSMSKKSRINSGPSMFPFLHNSKEKFLLEKNKDNFEMMLQHSYAPEKFATVKNNCNKEETFDNIINKIATSTSPIFIQIKNDIQSSANHIQLQMPALMDAGTQMYIDYHNEETDAFRDRFASSVATVTSSHVFHSPSAANTETKHIHADNNKDTESENKIKKSYDIETQAVPTRPIRISRAITTPPIGRRDCTVAGTTTSVDAIQKKHFAVQAIPLTTTFTYTKPKLLSISSAMMKTTSATVSKQDVTTAGVPGNDVNLIESCQGLTAPYPQNCLCNRADYKPCKNETKAADRLNSSSYIISHNPQNYKRTVNADIFITKGEYHPPPCVNHNLLMSELFYKLNHTVDEMATQTEQHHNEVGTTPSAALPKPCQLPKFATAVPTQTSESFINKVKDTEPCRGCACAAPKYDCGTSTKASNLACATQTSPHQRNKEITISACNQICSKPSRKQIPNIHDPINDKIVSLSRLIGQRDANTENNSHRHPSSMPSSALNATNWIKTCASLQRREYACQSVENCDKSILEDLKHLNSDMITSTSEPYNKINNKPVKHKDFVISTLPAFTLSRDSLADVLPIQKVVKCISSTEIPSKDPIMVDQATSDVVNVKDVKECTLQACPEISNKATDFPVSENRKSACVLTSRCLLPTAAPYCYPNSFDQVPKDCVFIYREPRCVVYNQQTDAEVQRKPSNKDVEVEPIDIQHQTHVSVGSSIPSGKPICYHKKSTDIAGEVLSPRVYKALYETTKLVFKEDLSQSLPINYLHQQPSFRNAAINSKPLNTDFKFTMVQNPEVRSATVMTTQCKSLQKSRHFVDQSTQPDDVETKDRDVDVNTQTHSACRVSFTDVTAEKDCSEDCVKTHLAASCRYYSNLLTKQIGRVKENLTRHLAPPTDTTYRYNLRLPRVEACTMKPSARQELGCQTNKICRYCDIKKPTAYLLSPTSSLTDICRYDREHLKSVYYILSAIEGRIRRLKANVPT